MHCYPACHPPPRLAVGKVASPRFVKTPGRPTSGRGRNGLRRSRLLTRRLARHQTPISWWRPSIDPITRLRRIAGPRRTVGWTSHEREERPRPPSRRSLRRPSVRSPSTSETRRSSLRQRPCAGKRSGHGLVSARGGHQPTTGGSRWSTYRSPMKQSTSMCRAPSLRRGPSRQSASTPRPSVTTWCSIPRTSTSSSRRHDATSRSRSRASRAACRVPFRTWVTDRVRGRGILPSAETRSLTSMESRLSRSLAPPRSHCRQCVCPAGSARSDQPYQLRAIAPADGRPWCALNPSGPDAASERPRLAPRGRGDARSVRMFGTPRPGVTLPICLICAPREPSYPIQMRRSVRGHQARADVVLAQCSVPARLGQIADCSEVVIVPR